MSNLPSIPSIPNVDPALYNVLNAVKANLEHLQISGGAVTQSQLEETVTNSLNAAMVNIQSEPGAEGAPGKSYILDITGGRTTIIYDDTGANPLPAMTAFSCELYEDGVAVTEGITYSWYTSSAANSMLSGTSDSSVFTPTVASTFDATKADNTVYLSVSYAGLSLTAKEPISITKVGAQGSTGAQGPQGDAGTSGLDSYFHVAYADSADGSTNFNQTSGQYIGTYVDHTATDSTDYLDYNWVLIKGAQGATGDQGIPGVDGADGTTSYLHIKYSNDNGATFTANNGETVGKYIGQYVDQTITDSTNVGDYTWAQIRGDSLLLFITGGKTNAVYDDMGENPLPAPAAFSCELYLNGTQVTPETYAWSVPSSNSMMNGSSSVATFTPTYDANYDSANADNRVLLTVTYGEHTVKAVQPVTITRLYSVYSDQSVPEAIDNLEVTGGIMYNILTWGTVPAITDHVNVYRAAANAEFGAGTLTLNGNATVNGNVLNKASGSGAWDVQGYSTESYTGGCAVKFSFGNTTSMLAAGLNTDPTTNAGRDTLDYCWQANADGTLDIYESGARVNGPDTPVIDFAPGTLTLNGNATIAGGDISKASGSSAWDVQAYSTQSYTPAAACRFQFGSINHQAAAGLTSDPTTDASYTSIDYAIVGNADGTFNIVENGNYIINPDNFTPVFTAGSLTLNGNATIATNDVSKGSGSSAWDTQAYSTESITDACAVRFKFGDATKKSACGLNADGFVAKPLNLYATGNATVTSNSVTKNSGTTAWDSQAYSLQNYTGNCAVRFKFGATNKGAFGALKDEPTSEIADAGYQYLDYAILGHASGVIYIYESNVEIGTYGSYTTSDVFEIEYSSTTITYKKNGSTIRTVSTTAGRKFYFDCSLNNVGASINSIEFGQYSTVSDTGLSSIQYALVGDSGGKIHIYEHGNEIVNPDNNSTDFAAGTLTFTLTGTAGQNGTTISKNSGADGYDSQGYSNQSISNGCVIRFKFGATNKYAAAGLNTDPSTNASWTSLDYGFIGYNNGTLHIVEIGSDIGAAGSYTTSDLFEVEYTGTKIIYKKNGVSIRSVDALSNRVFYFDSALYSVGSTITNIELGTYVTTTDWGDYINTDVMEVEYSGNEIKYKQNDITLHSLITDESQTFKVDSCLYDVGAAVNDIEFGTYSLSTSWGDYAVTDVFEIEYSVTSVIYKFNGDTIYVSETTAERTFYFDSSLYDVGASITDIQFGDYREVSGWGAYDQLDTFEIEYTGTQIKYKKNDQTLRTVNVDTGLTLYFDSSMHTVGGYLVKIYFGTYLVRASRADATCIGTSQYNIYADYIPKGVDNIYYYWIRSVSPAQVLGDWNLVNGQVSSDGTPARAMGINDSHVDQISATKIVCYALSAFTANLGEVTAGVIKSPDDTFRIDLADKAITIAGPNGVDQDDYTIIKNGVMQFFKWTGAAHQMGQSLQTIESGVARNGETVVLDRWYSKIPKIIVSPFQMPLYKAAYSGQNQTLQLFADDIEITAGGEVSFKPISRLVLSGSNPSTTVNQSSGSTSSNSYTSTAYVTDPNTTKISVSVSVSSQRGTGTAPKYYYRKVSVRLGWRTYGSTGAYNYTAYVVSNIGGDFNANIVNLTTGTIASGKYQFIVQYVAADSGGIFSSGVGGYDYAQNDIALGANTALFSASSQGASSDSKNASISLASFTPQAGYSIYKVDYHISYGYYLTAGGSNAQIDTATASVEDIINGSVFHYTGFPPGSTIGTVNVPSAMSSFSWSQVVYEQNKNIFSVKSDSSYYSFNSYGEATAQCRIFASGTYARIYSRKSKTNSVTPSNKFTLINYSLTLSTATIIDSSGTLQYLVVA